MISCVGASDTVTHVTADSQEPTNRLVHAYGAISDAASISRKAVATVYGAAQDGNDVITKI